MEEKPRQQNEKPLSEDEYYIKLPHGCRFRPTDEELIVHYLKNKILNQTLHPHMIRDVNIYEFHPQRIPEMYPLKREQVWYFFTPGNRKYGGKKRERSTEDGYWKSVDGKKEIFTEGQRVGFKQTLSFLEGTNWRSGTSTQWRMKEYSLDLKSAPSSCRAPHDVKFDDWILCKIYMTEWGKKNLEQDSEEMMVTGANEERSNAVPKPQSVQIPVHWNRFYSSEINNSDSNMPNYAGRNEGRGYHEPSDSHADMLRSPVNTMGFLVQQMTHMISLQKRQSKKLSAFVRETRQQHRQFDHHLCALRQRLHCLEDDLVADDDDDDNSDDGNSTYALEIDE